MYPYSEFIEAGGLMSYASDQSDLWQRAADFVDKILKGNKPATFPSNSR
jgi:putative ABC transport system substrate-binding protein